MEDFRFRNGFRKLIAWQEAHAFTKEIYEVTAMFPRHEQFGMTTQLRKASSSIAAQIAEGSRMHTSDHRRSYYNRAYASGAECDNFLELAKDLRYIDEATFKRLLDRLNRVCFLTYRLFASCPS